MEINIKTANTILKALRIAKHSVTFEYSKKELIANIGGVEPKGMISYLEKQTSIIELIDDLEKVERDFEKIANRQNNHSGGQ